jgi:hypothetical protein
MVVIIQRDAVCLLMAIQLKVIGDAGHIIVKKNILVIFLDLLEGLCLTHEEKKSH